MARTASVTLGGTQYEVPKFNIGQLERVADAIAATDPGKAAFGILRIAFERVEPKVSLDTVEADPEEIAAAMSAIMELAGLRPPKANP